MRGFEVITFIEIFFRYTPASKVMILSPINVIQNWKAVGVPLVISRVEIYMDEKS